MSGLRNTAARGATLHPPNPLQRGNNGRDPGFTLVELLVALAIFAVLMAAVTTLFVGSLRTTQVGYQQMKAFEQARTALSVIDEDLVRGFASKQTADVHSFYGTPIGMTFIGVVKASSDAKDRNLARVTYVIYNQETGAVFQGALDDTDASGNPIARDGHQYALVRYVEPSVANLDALPFSLDQAMPAEGGPIARTYRDVLNLLCANSYNPPRTSFDSARVDLTEDEQDRVRAKICEMWIRMVAGGDREMPANFWRDILNKDVSNYIVTDAILATATEGERYADPFVTGLSTPFFTYDCACRPLNPCTNCPNSLYWWNAPQAILSTDGGDCCPTSCPCEKWPPTSLPQIVAVSFWLMFESPYPGAPDFKRRFVQEVDLPVGYQRSKPKTG